MTHESRPKKAAPADALNVGEKSSENEGQDAGRYDEQRYAPVSVRLWQQFPDSGARAFAIAVSLGRLVDANGGSDRLRNGKQAYGSRIRPDRLPVVLEAVGITDRTWRRHVEDWVERYVAHKCARGTVTLFTKPFPDTCPGCGAEIEWDHERASMLRKPLPRGPKGRFATKGERTVTVRASDGDGPPRGRERSEAMAENGPPVSTDAAHLVPGINGMEVGTGSPEPLTAVGSVPDLQSQERLSKVAARIVRERGFGLSDRDVAALLNGQEITPPAGFVRWTGFAVRVAMGEATHAA